MANTKNVIDNIATQRALQIAFQTMQERCHQLENRLAAVEEENVRLRVKKIPDDCSDIVVCHRENNDLSTVRSLEEKIEELIKQKSQLTHNVLMVAAENRQLWNRLTRLTRTNKSLGSKLIKISDTLKQNPNTNTSDIKSNTVESCNIKIENTIDNDIILQSDSKDGSLEEISLRLINSIMMEKSELEQQCSEMIELQNGTDIDLKTVGFTYPDDSNTDSLQQLKQHEEQLYQTKTSLLLQQSKLQKVLKNLRKIKKASKKFCQTGTQFDSDDSLREHGSTQTSFPLPTTSSQILKYAQVLTSNKIADEPRMCPICGESFNQSVSFQSFHEHVCGHFYSETTATFEFSP